LFGHNSNVLTIIPEDIKLSPVVILYNVPEW